MRRGTKRRRPTLRGGLVARYVGVLAGLLLATSVLQYTALRHFLIQAAERQLSGGARTAIQDYWRSHDARRLARVVADPQTTAWVVDATGHVVASVHPPHGPTLQSVPSVVGPPGQVWRGFVIVRLPLTRPARHRPPPTGPISGDTLILARPLDAVQQILAREAQTLAIGGAVALVVAGGIGGWVLGRGLKPLEVVAETADAVAAGDLAQRTSVDLGTPEEVARVGRAFNSMLDRLAAALEQEQRAREEMHRFLMDASHELRTPVTAIAGFLEVLRAGAAQDPTTLDRSLGATYAQARRMAMLVDRLLALARLQQPSPLHLEIVDLHAWLDGLWPELEAVATGHPLTRRVAPDTEPYRVRMDGEALGRALLNLVDNAAKYSPWESGIEVRLERSDAWAQITVTDQGPGIPEDERAHVFERFARGRAALASRVPGTGLGLAIVRAVVLAHGGEVTLVCPSEGGTRVTIRLPLAI